MMDDFVVHPLLTPRLQPPLSQLQTRKTIKLDTWTDWKRNRTETEHPHAPKNTTYYGRGLPIVLPIVRPHHSQTE